MTAIKVLLIFLPVVCLGQTGASQVFTRQNGTGAVLRSVENKFQESVSILDYGTQQDCVTYANARLLVANAAAIAQHKRLYFPGGACIAIDNSSTAFTVNGATGTWYGDGPGSHLVFSSLGNPGISSFNATNFTIENMAFSFGPDRTTRSTATPILNFGTASNLTLRHLSLFNGNCQGIAITVGDHLTILDISIDGVLANPIQISNASDGIVDQIHCTNSGDVCIEIDKFNSNGSHLCQDWTISNFNSIGGNGGFLAESCHHVDVSNFNITTGTNSNYIGLAIVFENAVSPTITPDDINISNGFISGGGGVNGCILIANIDVASPPANVWNVAVNNVRMKNCAGDGINIGDDGKTHANVILNNISIDTTGTSHLFTGVGKGVRLGGDRVSGSNITVANSCEEPFILSAAKYVDLTNIKSVNGNQCGVSTNAFEVSSGGSSLNLHTLVNGFAIDDANATSRSNIDDGTASSTYKMFLNIDHTQVTGTGWTATTVNPYSTIFRTLTSNYWDFDTVNARGVVPPGYHIGLSNGAPLDLAGSDGIYYSGVYTSGGDNTVIQSNGKAGSKIGLAVHTGSVVLSCLDSTGVCSLLTTPGFANNAAAIAGGLVAGQIYRNGDALQIVH